jgi:DNA-binding transcriptional ArsR family regulator
MRPLYHPAAADITVQGILHALSDPVRIRIMMELLTSESTLNCTDFLHIYNAPLPKSTLSKHIGILREAGLLSAAPGLAGRGRTGGGDSAGLQAGSRSQAVSYLAAPASVARLPRYLLSYPNPNQPHD